MEILQSRTLIKKVVEELDLYISYATKSSFHDIELYKSSPVKVWITPEEAQKLPAPARLHLTLQPGNKLNVKLRIGEEEYNKQFDKLPALLTTPSGTFSFTPKDSTTVQSTQEIMATVSSPPQCGKHLPGSIEHRAYFQIHHYRTDLCQEHAYAARHGFHQQAGGSLQPGCQR